MLGGGVMLPALLLVVGVLARGPCHGVPSLVCPAMLGGGVLLPLSLRGCPS